MTILMLLTDLLTEYILPNENNVDVDCPTDRTVAVHPAILGCIFIKLNLQHCGDFVQVHGKPAERPGRILCSMGPNPKHF
jgi:hypothetical protein